MSRVEGMLAYARREEECAMCSLSVRCGMLRCEIAAFIAVLTYSPVSLIGNNLLRKLGKRIMARPSLRYSQSRSNLNQLYFFSSRRRHTRFKCDWSSDVCSSD